jgi:hypothetical protein
VFAVAAGEGVEADNGQFLEHLETIFEVAHAAALVVGPAHGDFDDTEAALDGDEKDFGVESPALDGLKLEDGLRRVAGEGFESALGIGEGQVHDHAANHVEAAAEDLPVKRLAVSLAAAFKPAGADGDVGAVGDGSEEAVGFFDGGGEVGVSEHHDIALGLQDAGADTVAFAPVAGVFNQADLRGMEGEVAYKLGGGVSGTVVDDDDFGGPFFLANAGYDGLKRGRNAGAFVVSRDDDAVFGILHSRLSLPYSTGIKGGKTLEMITPGFGLGGSGSGLGQK